MIGTTRGFQTGFQRPGLVTRSSSCLTGTSVSGSVVNLCSTILLSLIRFSDYLYQHLSIDEPVHVRKNGLKVIGLTAF
jgi:hypothetical protein